MPTYPTPREAYFGNPATPGYEPSKTDLVRVLEQIQAIATTQLLKGFVSAIADLPTTGNTTGDVYSVMAAGDDGGIYQWNGTGWVKISALPPTLTSDAFAALAQAWAESPTPPDPNDLTSRSAKTIAEELAAASDGLIEAINDTLLGPVTEYVYTFSGNGGSTHTMSVPVDDPRKIDLTVDNSLRLRPEIDYDVSGFDLVLVPGGVLEAWPVGTDNITVRVRRQVDLADITSDDVTYEGVPLTGALDTLLPGNAYNLLDYLHPDDAAGALSGNTAAQDGARVVSAFRACFEAALAAMWATDGAAINVIVPGGIYRINDRLMSDAFNSSLWNYPASRTRSRIRFVAEGPVTLRIQGWAPGRASMRTDGIYAGSTVIAPNAVFEWFQPTGLQNFGGMSGQWIIEGANSLTSDPVGFYFYRLNATRLEGTLEVRNLRNRNFVFDSIFNSEAEYVRSQDAAGISLTEAGGTGLLPADTVVGNVRTGIRYTLSGATITLNTMVYDSVAGTYSFTPASIFTADHVGKWIGLDRQGQENVLGDDSDDGDEGGSTRRNTRWFQIVGVTDGATATLATTPPQQGTAGQMAAQNRMVSFEALTVSTTAGSTTATLSMPTTTSLVGLEIAIGGVPYNGGPTDQPNMVAMVTAHTGATLTLSHAAGATKSGTPLVLAPQVHIGNCAHTWDKSTSRKADDFHIGRLWCESGATPAVPLFIQRTTNVTLGEQSKLHGSPTSTQNFGANWCCVFGGEVGGRWQGRYTHSRHSRRFGMFTITGDRTELTINGELSSWTPDDQSAIFYLDPANVATTRIWDIYFNAHDYASGFPITAGGQVFERGGANYTPGRVKAGASQRNPRGERPSWPPAFLPASRAPAWGSTRADAEAAVARGWVPENGVVYTIGGLQYLGQTGATAIADLPGLVWAGERDVRHFGAESGAADVRAAFAAARDSIPAGQAGKVIVPPGVWNISTPMFSNNGNFVEWDIQDGASVLPSVDSRISGTTWRINYPRQGAVERTQIRDIPVSAAQGQTIGRYAVIENSGLLNETGYGERIGYTSSAYGSGRFDIATAVIAQFNRAAGQGGGQSLAQWLVTSSPTTGDGTSDNAWGSFVAEWNIMNRGQDTGFTPRRALLQNWTGGLQMVIEDDLLGVDPNITKNVTFGFMFSGQTPTGNDVDRRRYYAGILGEPNCIAGLTGRAIYWTGDTTNQVDRIPLAFVEAAGRWGYGLKLNDGTFDTAAIAVPNGSKISWQSTAEAESGSILITANGSIAMGNAAPAPGSTINRIFEGSGSGVYSRSRNILRRSMSSPSGVNLTTNGAGTDPDNILVIPDTSTALFEGTVLAANSSGVSAMWTVRGIVDRRSGAGTTTVKGVTATNVHADAGAATWSVAATANTTHGGVVISVSGTGDFNALADITLTLIDFA